MGGGEYPNPLVWVLEGPPPPPLSSTSPYSSGGRSCGRTGKGGICDGSVGAGVGSEVGGIVRVVGIVIGNRIRVICTSSQAGEGWKEGAWWRVRQLEQICVHSGGKRGRGGPVMTREARWRAATARRT